MVFIVLSFWSIKANGRQRHSVFQTMQYVGMDKDKWSRPDNEYGSSANTPGNVVIWWRIHNTTKENRRKKDHFRKRRSIGQCNRMGSVQKGEHVHKIFFLETPHQFRFQCSNSKISLMKTRDAHPKFDTLALRVYS